MTDLSITDIAAAIAILTGTQVVRYPTKDKATAKLEKVLAPVVGETSAPKAAAAILACANREHAEQAAFSIKAEAERDARVVQAAATIVSPGLARLRAHPKAEAIRQQTVEEASAVTTTGVYPFEKARKRRDALAQIEAIAPAPEATEQPKKARAPKAKAEPKPKAEGRAQTVRNADDAIISAVVENPKKAGSRAAAVFAHYRAGQTVADFIAACAAGGIAEKEARSNLSWDRRKGFITIGAAPEAESTAA